VQNFYDYLAKLDQYQMAIVPVLMKRLMNLSVIGMKETRGFMLENRTCTVNGNDENEEHGWTKELNGPDR
jgi:hypothetical protein